MKRTGRTVYLSGTVSVDTADATYTNLGTVEAYFQNILVDERKGYAYKVTFVSTFPTVTNGTYTDDNNFALQTFSGRELRRMTNDELQLHSGRRNVSLASDNRTVAIVGSRDLRDSTVNRMIGYQTNYVTKGDAMVTEALSICADALSGGPSSSDVSYYIELDEYTVNDNEEIMLLLNERAQNAGN